MKEQKTIRIISKDIPLFKTTLLILTFFIFIWSAKGQDMNAFYAQMNIATNLANEGKTDSAIITYENAFKEIDYVNTTYLKKVLVLAKTNKDKSRINKYSELVQTQLKGTNPALITEIDSLLKKDQQVRQNKYYKASTYYYECNKDSSCDKNSKKFLRAKSLANEWKTTDQNNLNYLLNLSKKHGYIGEELIGENAFYVYIMLLHFDTDTNNVVMQPILEKALAEGKVSPLQFAQVLDRHLFFIGNTQKYWTWPCVSKSKKLEFSGADINQLRESIGIYDSAFSQEQVRGYWVLKNQYND